jgi:hypothetical protein
VEVNRENPDKGIWFHNNQEKPDDSFSLRLRFPSASKGKWIISQASVTEDVESDGEIVQETKHDNEKLNDLLLDHAIAEWKGFTENKAPMPCTLENKKFIITEINSVRIFYLECMDKLQVMLQLKKERTAKN